MNEVGGAIKPHPLAVRSDGDTEPRALRPPGRLPLRLRLGSIGANDSLTIHRLHQPTSGALP